MKMRPSISWQGDLLYGRSHSGCVLFNTLLACLNLCLAVVSWRGAIDVLECFRFKYCKVTVLRLIRIRDAFVTDVMVPGSTLIYDALKLINCWKGERGWFTYDILSFQKEAYMKEALCPPNQRNHAVVSWRGNHMWIVVAAMAGVLTAWTVLRLIRIRDAFVTDVMVPGATLIYDVVKLINCWKGEQEAYMKEALCPPKQRK
nr:hypothetical protein [Tanacetum cinerariifolium]